MSKIHGLTQKVFRLSPTYSLKPVWAWIYSNELPYAIYVKTSFPSLFSKTANSVINILTTPFAVNGNTHCYKIFLSTAPVFLLRAECSITTITLDPHATKSIAPPIPFTNLPGIIQFAMSQVWLTWSDPKIVKSRWPPLIIPNDWEEENREPPGKIVTVS